MICLATYNIWNSSEGMPFRSECIMSEISKVLPDILCLQEVKDKELSEKIASVFNLNLKPYKCIKNKYDKEFKITYNPQFSNGKEYIVFPRQERLNILTICKKLSVSIVYQHIKALI